MSLEAGSKYRSRKWIAFWFGAVTNIILLATGLLTGGEFVTLQALLFGFYSAANVFSAKK